MHFSYAIFHVAVLPRLSSWCSDNDQNSAIMKNKSELEQANMCAFEPAGLFFYLFLFVHK